MKAMNARKRYGIMPLNIQFFAEGGDGDGGEDAGDDDDDQDDDKSKGSGKKTFTQEELDAAIEKRLKREREKAKKEAEKARAKAEDDKNKTEEQKAKEKSEKETKAQADKVSALEAKLLCFEHDVAKDCVSDVVALAKAYVDEDTDFEEAIEKVIKKYPQFVKDSGKASKKRDKGAEEEEEDEDDEEEEEEETDNKPWGKRQTGKSKKMDGVEAAFLKKNPGLKID